MPLAVGQFDFVAVPADGSDRLDLAIDDQDIRVIEACACTGLKR